MLTHWSSIDIVTDALAGFLVKARLERVIHGQESEDGKPASLIVFGFRFHGINKRRRFRSVVINIRFQHEKDLMKSDPEVVALWPDGDFTLSKSTASVQDTKSIEGAIKGGSSFAGASTTGKWERQANYQTDDRATLVGSTFLDMTVRKAGKDNAILLSLYEDESANSGIISDLRTAVLLRRNSDADKFLAFISIKATADFKYNFLKGIRDLTGNTPPNKPVVFEPGVQYDGPLGQFKAPKVELVQTAHPEDKLDPTDDAKPKDKSDPDDKDTPIDKAHLKDQVNPKNLNAVILSSLGRALSTTILKTVNEE
jgi:hypothetical protein